MSSTAVSRPRVYVRIRPLNERELVDGKGEVMCRGSAAQPDVLFLRKSAQAQELQARFDHVFEGCDSQAKVYDTIGHEVQQTLMSGYNASIFAYGQTGSGKTYTMEGGRFGGRRGSIGGTVDNPTRDKYGSGTSMLGGTNRSTTHPTSPLDDDTHAAAPAAAASASASAATEDGPNEWAVCADNRAKPVEPDSPPSAATPSASQAATPRPPIPGSGGLVPRLLHGIFAHFEMNTNITNARVQLSLVQIYQEHIQDLLNGRQNLDIHMDRTGQYVARDATWRTVHDVRECMRVYNEGCARRATSSTEMNLVSSRSHMILMLRLQWDEPTLPGSRAQLNLIDLAGSERLHDSGASGETRMEAIHINKSLSALSNVVIKLVEQSRRPRQRIHIPYKDSKLTYLLQSSLGGANLIHFVLTLSCSALWRSETVSTIEFGKRALQLILRPVRNAIDVTRLAEMEAMIENMRCHIASLEEQLRTKRSSEATQFLQLRQLAQDEMTDSLPPLLSGAPTPRQSASTMTQAGGGGGGGGGGARHAGSGEHAHASDQRRRGRRVTDDDEVDEEGRRDDDGDRLRRSRRSRNGQRRAAATERAAEDTHRNPSARRHRRRGATSPQPTTTRRHSRASRRRRHLAQQTELMRIMANLPETFDDLTSHCVLFPESKETFVALGGLDQLVHFIDHCASNYYRAHAAHTLASVMSESGRHSVTAAAAIAALVRLLQVADERCKESACVALEAVCRGCVSNKETLPDSVYTILADLVYDYPNQQVQEMACAALATIADGYPAAVGRFAQANVVPKLLHTIRHCPAEVVNLIKAATNCVGRLAHSTESTAMQEAIAQHGGIDLLIDVLFSRVGEQDHQVPILASYALVNVCCGRAESMACVRHHPRYPAVKFRLLEGLARAFGSNTAREGFGRATAQERHGPFPYYGVTVLGKWDESNSGGRPIFATFMENPQFYLYVHASQTTDSAHAADYHSDTHTTTNGDCADAAALHDRRARGVDVAFIVQDTLYESRLRQKRRNNAVYMGLAIFEGQADLARAGLKQLDFHGTMLEMSRYTSNCENVLHLRLEPRATPYVVVPFTSQRARCTNFALSVFGDGPVELTAVPESAGWVHRTLRGRWNEWNGRGGDGFDWRCNPQLGLRAGENCRVVVVLSYRRVNQTSHGPPAIHTNNTSTTTTTTNNNSNSNAAALDESRSFASREDAVVVGGGTVQTCLTQNHALHTRQAAALTPPRPRLHGRLFRNAFAPDRRYLRALVPLPQLNNFVASNSFASTSYIATSAFLQAGEDYVYIPFTEEPYVGDYRVSLYCDSEEVELTSCTASREEREWLSCGVAGVWTGSAISMEVQCDLPSRMVAVVYSPGTFVRMQLYRVDTPDHDADADAPLPETGDEEKKEYNSTRAGMHNAPPSRSPPSPSHVPDEKGGGGSGGAKWLTGMEAYWNSEASLVYDGRADAPSLRRKQTLRLTVEGVTRASSASASASASSSAPIPARQGGFDVVFFTDAACQVSRLDFVGKPTAWSCPTRTTLTEWLHYPQLVRDDALMEDGSESEDDHEGRMGQPEWWWNRSSSSPAAAAAAAVTRECVSEESDLSETGSATDVGHGDDEDTTDGELDDETDESILMDEDEEDMDDEENTGEDSCMRESDAEPARANESQTPSTRRQTGKGKPQSGTSVGGGVSAAKMQRALHRVKRENAKLRRKLEQQARQMASLTAAPTAAGGKEEEGGAGNNSSDAASVSWLPSLEHDKQQQQQQQQQQQLIQQMKQRASSTAVTTAHMFPTTTIANTHDASQSREKVVRANIAAARRRQRRASGTTPPSSRGGARERVVPMAHSTTLPDVSAPWRSTNLSSEAPNNAQNSINSAADKTMTNEAYEGGGGRPEEVNRKGKESMTEEKESWIVPSPRGKNAEQPLLSPLTAEWPAMRSAMDGALRKLRAIGEQMTHLCPPTSTASLPGMTGEGGKGKGGAAAVEGDVLCAQLRREVEEVQTELRSWMQRCEAATSATLGTSETVKGNRVAKAALREMRHAAA